MKKRGALKLTFLNVVRDRIHRIMQQGLSLFKISFFLYVGT